MVIWRPPVMTQGLSTKRGHGANSALEVRTRVMETSLGSRRAKLPSGRLLKLSGLGLWAPRLHFTHMLSLPRNIVFYWDS